jgi:2',3'-cyclic-nucleotide 2'-phosphodiesterase (5'-nucleotidase family)
MRIITYVVEVEIEIEESEKEQDFTVILVAIYDKSEMESLPDKELKELIDEIELELEEDE